MGPGLFLLVGTCLCVNSCESLCVHLSHVQLIRTRKSSLLKAILLSRCNTCSLLCLDSELCARGDLLKLHIKYRSTQMYKSKPSTSQFQSIKASTLHPSKGGRVETHEGQRLHKWLLAKPRHFLVYHTKQFRSLVFICCRKQLRSET